MATQNAVNTSLSGQTGTGNFVGANTPTLITPVLGVATATSINKMAITAPATGSTIAVADGKTLTQSNTLTYTGVDGSTVNFGAGGTVAYTGSITSWINVTGTSQVGAAGEGYIANNAGLVTISLPATAAVGTTFGVVGNGAGGWTITQAASQVMHIGSQPTTTGVGGSVSSTNRYDSVQFVCTVANLEWVTMGAPQSSGLTWV